MPELAKEDWLARCASPLGMSDDDTFFNLNPNLLSELRQVKDTGFREFYHRFVYIECRDVLERLMGVLSACLRSATEGGVTNVKITADNDYLSQMPYRI